MYNWILKEQSSGELKASINGKIWEDAQDKATNKLIKELKIDGFRKGKVPKNIALKHINKQSILIEALEQIAQQILEDGLKEYELEIIDRPSLNIDKIDSKQADITFKITIPPIVKLGKYKGLAKKIKDPIVSDQEVDAEIEKVLDKHKELIIKDGGKVSQGDTAIIDFEGFLNGVAFDGGKGLNHPLVIGSKSFIPGFEEQLIGMETNQEKDINVTFPKDYNSKELKGKDVVFKVLVHEIKEPILPKLDSDFIKELNIENVKDENEYRQHLMKELIDQKRIQLENEANNKLLDEVIKNTPIELPLILIENEKNEMLNEYQQRLTQQGLTLDALLKMSGQTKDQMKEMFNEDAKKRVSLRLILKEICKVENISVSDQDLEDEYLKLSTQYKMEVDKIKEALPKDYFINDLKYQKALDLIGGK